MTFTGHRTIQYIGLFLILGLLAGGYWYFSVRAGVKTNTGGSQSQGVGDLSAGLTAYFALDENTGTAAADSSTNAITSLTLTNSPTWTTGQINSAIDFDGTNDYATTADTDILDFGDTDDFTLSAWFNREGTGTGDAIIAKRNSFTTADVGYIFDISSTTDKITFEVSDGTDEFRLTSTTTFTTSGWHHVAIVFDQDSTANSEIYIDGAKDNAAESGTIGNVGSLANALAFVIGAQSDGAGDFDGKLDEVRVYDRPLSPEEIANLYRLTTPTGVDTSLKGYWSFNGTETSSSSSTTTYDRSGARNTATLTNGPTKAIGKLGQALTLDGADDYVTVPDVAALDVGDTEDLTLTGWFNRSTFTTFDGVIAKRQGLAAAYPGYLAFITASTDTLQVEFSDGTDEYVIESTSTFTTAGWHHFAIVWDQDSTANTEIYIDGVADGATDTGTIDNIGAISNAQVLASGALSDGTYPFAGSLDEFRLYKRTLSAAEIKALYTASQSDKSNTSASQSQGTGRLDSGLTGYWEFDENTGTSAADASTNGNTGTLTNGPTWTTGQINSALDFDGTDDYVAVTDTAVLDFGDGANFTLTGWFNRDTETTDDTIMAKRDGTLATDVGIQMALDDATDKLHFEVSDGTDEYELKTTQTFTTPGWYHFAVVWDQDSPGNSEIYINGVDDDATDTGTIGNVGDLSNALEFRIASESNASGDWFDGKLDEIRIYDRALSTDEITNLYRLTTPTGVDTNLEGYWSFNGSEMSSSSSTTTYDRSGARNTGTLTNGPTKGIGTLGQGLTFDGTDDYVTVPDAAGLDITGELTLSAWIKKTADTPTAGWADIVTKADTDSNPANYWLQISDISGKEYLSLYFYAAGAYHEIRSTTTLTWGEWHHVAATYNDAANSITLYIDGVASGDAIRFGTPESQSMETNTYPLRIGHTYGSQQFPGIIDEVRVYSRTLSASEIKAQYDLAAPDKQNTSASQSQGTGRLDSGLTAYFALDENTGTAAADSSTNAITSLTLTNSPAWTTGQIGTAIDFDGTDDYATTADTATLDFGDTEDFTLSAWFNRDTFTADHTIIAKRNGITAGDTGYVVYIDDATDKVVFEISDGTDEYSLTSTATFTATGWHHVALVWDQDNATTAEAYIDGIADNATDAGTIGNIGALSNAVAFRLGAESDNGNPFDGKLDEVRVYDRPLSSGEIANLYRLTTPTGVDTSLKGYWSFNGSEMSSSSSTTTYDRSGARNTGTLTNGPTKGIGTLGQGLTFDGTDDYVTVPDASSLEFNYNVDFSLSIWVKIPTTQSDTTAVDNSIVEKWLNSGDAFPYAFRLYNQTYGVSGDRGKVLFKRFDLTNAPSVTTRIPLNDNVWHLLTATKSGSTLSLYVDGILNGTATDTTTTTTTNAAPLTIAQRGSNLLRFQGSLDELRIYSRALSASEIKALYDSSR